MNKLLKPAIFFILALSLAVTACSKNLLKHEKNKKDISLAKIAVKKELVIGLAADHPPFTFSDEETLTLKGYDIDMMRAVCTKLGLQANFQIIPWKKKDEILNKGEVDCIVGGFSYSDARAKKFSLSKIYLKTATVLVVRESSNYKELDALKHKKIGLEKGSSLMGNITKIAKQYNGFSDIVFFDGNAKALQALENEKVDAVVNDLLFTHYSLHTANKPYRIIPKPIAAYSFVICFRKGDIKLKEKIEEALFFLTEDDTIPNISRKWFGTDLSMVGK